MNSLVLAASLTLVSAAAWSATGSAQLGVGVTVIDQCAVGNAAGAQTSWVCTSGTTATLAYALGTKSSGSYRRLESATASSSPSPASSEHPEGRRLTILFAP